LVDKGGISFGEEDYYDIIKTEIIEKIANKLGMPNNDNIVIIPGNHDINENEVEEITEGGLKTTVNSIEKINDFVKKNLNGFTDGIKRIKKYKNFEQELYNSFPVLRKQLSNFESCFVFEIDGRKIGVAAFNSAWRCSSSLPHNKLFLGTEQIIRASSFFKSQETIFNIGLIHHPIELFSEIEKTEINKFFITNSFDLLLSGHTHMSDTSQKLSPLGSLFYSIGRTAFNNPREENNLYSPGFSIIDVNFLENSETGIVFNFRKFINARNVFDKDVEAASDGTYQNIITNKNLEERKYLTLTDKTFRAKQDILNSALVTHDTDSIAPNELDSIFVLPKLTDKAKALEDGVSQTVISYDISKLIEGDENYVIIGKQETGKTTLLNKIFIDAARSYIKHGLIPVRINFNEILGKEIKALVKDFLNEPDSAEINNLLQEGKILILIDNYTDRDEDIYAKRRLLSFIEDCPKCKIIITTSIDFDSLLIEENSLFRQKGANFRPFKSIFIGSIGVKEFKELALKWFKKKDSEWVQNKIERLIRFFEILKIPRTFFSITLYLWIIEKQENFKPINKSSLVHQFLLLILEGFKVDNVKAGAYSFDKKIELLSLLAYKMYEVGNACANYSINESVAIETIEKDFLANQLRLSATEKLREFLKKSILSQDVFGNIHFRYEAFFQYFLSLNIDRNQQFKEYIFKEENFLSFIDELDYYTGRRRDDFETLESIISRLKISYEEIDKFIEDNVDEYFPSTAVVFKHINDNKFIENTKRNKLTDAQVEATLDKQLARLPVQNSIVAKEKFDYKKKFNKVLELAARILKNSENIKNPQFINDNLNLIINKSAKYDVYMQSILASLLKDEDAKFSKAMVFIVLFGPLAHQERLSNWLGTDFLDVPVEKKITNYLTSSKGSFSEYEMFLTMSLYIDMKFHNYMEYTDRVIEKISNRFIAELFLIKLLVLYMHKPQGSSLLPKLEKQMEKLYMKARDIDKKGAIGFIKNTIKTKKVEMDNQLKLDLDNNSKDF